MFTSIYIRLDLASKILTFSRIIIKWCWLNVRRWILLVTVMKGLLGSGDRDRKQLIEIWRFPSFVNEVIHKNSFSLHVSKNSPGNSVVELFPCLLPQHIYAIICECAKIVRWVWMCWAQRSRERGRQYYKSCYFPAKDFQWEVSNPWVSHFIHEFRCSIVFEILLSYRFPKDKIFPIIVENVTVVSWQRLADFQNWYGFEFFLCPLRTLLSKNRE